MKKLTSMLLAVLIGCSFSLSAFAQEPVTSPDQIHIVITPDHIVGADTLTRNPDGSIEIAPRKDIGGTIRAGATKDFYKSGTTGWSLKKGALVSFVGTYTPSGVSVEYGYIQNGGFDRALETTTDGIIDYDWTVPADGTYSFYIYNKSSTKSISVTGSISV